MMTDQERSLLLTTAKQAGARAYCPYSRFRVGAAVMTGQGGIFGGCNVENASYGLTMCAERNAIFQAVAGTEGPLRLRALLVYTPTSSPTAPCGACRQVISEFGPDCEVLCLCDGSDEIVLKLADLLPSAFGPRDMRG
jgi:cytidine deaminase